MRDLKLAFQFLEREKYEMHIYFHFFISNECNPLIFFFVLNLKRQKSKFKLIVRNNCDLCLVVKKSNQHKKLVQ